MGFEGWGLGFRVWGLGVGEWSLGFAVCGMELRVWEASFLEFRDEGSSV